jgi:O-antigen/teichoic acid export membrane protein
LTTINNGIHSIARNALHLMATNLTVYLVRFIYVAICARFLGPEIYGLLVYGNTWYLVFLPIALMGLQPAISRMIGRDSNRAREISAQTLSLRILASLLAAVLCAGSGWLLSASNETAVLITVFSIALAFRSLALWANEIFNAFETSWRTLRQESLFRTTEVILGLVTLMSGGSIIALATVHGTVWLLQALRGLYLVNRKYTAINIDLSLGKLKPVLLMAIPFLSGSLLTNWELQGAIILFHNHAGDGPVSGSFALSIQIMTILSGLFAAITIAALPVLSRSAQRNDHKDLLFIDTLVRAAFLVCAMAGITGVALGPVLMPLIFGDRYVLAAQLIGPALWCLLPFSIAATLTAFTIARGHYYLSPACHLAGAAVLTLTMPPLVTALGPPGGVIAAGLGLATSATCLVTIALTRHWLAAGKTLAFPMLCIAGSVAIYTLLAPVSVWLALPAGLLALAGLALLSGVISAADRQLVRQLLGRPLGVCSK